MAAGAALQEAGKLPGVSRLRKAGRVAGQQGSSVSVRVWRCVVQSRAGQHLKHGQLLWGTSVAGGGTRPEIVYESVAWLVLGLAHVRTRDALGAAGASRDARLAKNLTKFGRPRARWLPLHRCLGCLALRCG
jgi:hypothetical protein